MHVNAKTAIANSEVLLVPYEAHHVPKYHQWMQSPELQEATASEPMSLEEEYENQQSWRTASDKLTFILCEPSPPPVPGTECGGRVVAAGEADGDDRMIGDINFFLYPASDDEGEDGTVGSSGGDGSGWIGEVDVMVAEKRRRGKGIGRAAVCSLLVYLWRHLDGIMSEQLGSSTRAADGSSSTAHATSSPCNSRRSLRSLMVKIKQTNKASRALFTKLGFEEEGDANYFGEVTLLLDWRKLATLSWWQGAVDDYQEWGYMHSSTSV